MSSHTFYVGDALTVLQTLPAESVQCCVTSPPYWGLRDYGVAGQMGLESTPDEYVAKMVEVFREVRRILGSDGTLWLNLGDSYNTQGGSNANPNRQINTGQRGQVDAGAVPDKVRRGVDGFKPKDLIGIPWRVAFALQGDGWYLRSDIIWAKTNPMPESVTDRPTKAHEYIFLLTPNPRYWYDAEAIQERATTGCLDTDFIPRSDKDMKDNTTIKTAATGASMNGRTGREILTRNKRDVWIVPLQPFPGAHFATFPEALIEPCILAGCPEGGTVLDSFGGSGTVATVARRLGRNSVYIDLNPDYCDMAIRRLDPGQQGLFESREVRKEVIA